MAQKGPLPNDWEEWKVDVPPLPRSWRRSVLFGQEGLELRGWWKRGELWVELMELIVEDYGRVMRAVELAEGRAKESRDMQQRHRVIFNRWSARHREMIAKLEGMRERYIKLYRRLRQAEAARNGGAALVDHSLYMRLSAKAGKTWAKQVREGKKTQQLFKTRGYRKLKDRPEESGNSGR